MGRGRMVSVEDCGKENCENLSSNPGEGEIFSEKEKSEIWMIRGSRREYIAILGTT